MKEEERKGDRQRIPFIRVHSGHLLKKAKFMRNLKKKSITDSQNTEKNGAAHQFMWDIFFGKIPAFRLATHPP